MVWATLSVTRLGFGMGQRGLGRVHPVQGLGGVPRTLPRNEAMPWLRAKHSWMPRNLKSIRDQARL